MSERRYSVEEIAKIFEVAADSPLPPAQPERGAEGMTLAELQAIGAEVGMPADAVARAALTLEVYDAGSPPTILGLRTGVERRVALQRTMTDDEWERLVVQLRDVFHARGRATSDGALRQWTNGNLYALVEPTPSGSRLRLGSRHGTATRSIRLGLVAVAGSAILSVAHVLGAATDPGSAAVFFAGGVALLASGALRVRPWARRREAQMEQIASELILSGPQATSLPPATRG